MENAAPITPAMLQEILTKSAKEWQQKLDERDAVHNAKVVELTSTIKSQKEILEKLENDTGEIDVSKISTAEYMSIRSTPAGRKRLGLRP